MIGEPEKIGGTIGVELGNLGFDYNTGRMYCVDYTNGGLGIIDLDTGAVDLLGTYSGDIGGPAITPAMCVTADGLIIVADMSGNLYTVDCDTMRTTKIGSSGADGWYYAGMTYDHDTGNIYWNPLYEHRPVSSLSGPPWYQSVERTAGGYHCGYRRCEQQERCGADGYVHHPHQRA